MDTAVIELARGQHGIVSRTQLLALGRTPDAVRWAIERRRLLLVHRGVYALGPALTAAGRDLAAVLACGAGATLSHRSAAVRWRLPVPVPARVDVTIARTTRARLHGVLLHRSRRPVAPVVAEGIPVTDLGRTLLDLADVVPYDVLHRSAMEAEHKGLLRLDTLRPIPGRRGNRSLERLLDHVAEGTRSQLETEVLAIVRRAGLPEPRRNVEIGPFTVDLAWPAQRVIVEADSWRWHSSREAFEADRARDLELRALGWTVLRVTWRQLHERPELLVRALRSGDDHGAGAGGR